MIRVGEIKGLKSLRALNAFSVLAIGLKMTPDYSQETFVDFFNTLQKMDEKKQIEKFTEAAMIVQLDPDEVTAMISFCSDRNGVPYGSENIKNLGPNELIQTLVAVCMEIVKIKIDSVTEDEKKN